MHRSSISVVLLGALAVGVGGGARALGQPLTTAFTYQGELTDGGTPALGLHDLRFRLFDAAAGGAQVGATLCTDNVSLAAGRFTVSLDFGAQFAGQRRFLEIDVRADTGLNCGSGAGFVTLTPRQGLTGAPNALFALSAAEATHAAASDTANSATTATTAATATNSTQLNGQAAPFYQNAANLTAGLLPGARLGGTYSGALTLTNSSNSFSGEGDGLTNMNASQLTIGALPGARLQGTYPNELHLNNLNNSFGGNGALLHTLNAGALQSGTVPNARLGGTYSGEVNFTNSGNFYFGSGAGLTGISAGALVGVLPNASLSGTYTNALSFDNAANVLTGDGRGLTNLDATRLTGGTVPGGRLAGTYANALTLSNAGNALTGNGAGLTNLNASQLASGTVPDLRVSGVYSRQVEFNNAANVFEGVSVESRRADGTSGAVRGVHSSANLDGVVGISSALTGDGAGVSGQSSSTTGRGVFGVCSGPTGNRVGVFGLTTSPTGYAVYGDGDIRANGDLTATGSKVGYVSDIVLNGGAEPLLPGDLVEIVGAADPIIGDIPVIIVRKGRTANSRAVLGPIDCALQISPLESEGDEELKPLRLRYEHRQYHVHKIAGAIQPGAYGRAVTLGSFKTINVDASFGAVRPGDLLVSSDNPGFAMRSDDPRVGTVVGKALGSLSDGTGVVGVLVQGR